MLPRLCVGRVETRALSWAGGFYGPSRFDRTAPPAAMRGIIALPAVSRLSAC